MCGKRQAYMPRKHAKLALPEYRVAEARRIIASQRDLITNLGALGRPTLDAERLLQSYLSALENLEGHERKIREEREAKKRETRKRQSNRDSTGDSRNFRPAFKLNVLFNRTTYAGAR
jgi:hypothetical protein